MNTADMFLSIGKFALNGALSIFQIAQSQMSYADIFMAPGKFGLNLLMTIFEIPPSELNGRLYIGIAFVIAGIIWLRCFRLTFELIKSTFSRW